MPQNVRTSCPCEPLSCKNDHESVRNVGAIWKITHHHHVALKKDEDKLIMTTVSRDEGRTWIPIRVPQTGKYSISGRSKITKQDYASAYQRWSMMLMIPCLFSAQSIPWSLVQHRYSLRQSCKIDSSDYRCLVQSRNCDLRTLGSKLLVEVVIILDFWIKH